MKDYAPFPVHPNNDFPGDACKSQVKDVKEASSIFDSLFNMIPGNIFSFVHMCAHSLYY